MKKPMLDCQKNALLLDPEVNISQALEDFRELKSKADIKSVACKLLENMTLVKGDKIVPAYESVSRILSIPVSTLRGWWKQKHAIIRTQQAMSQQLPEIVVMRLSISALRIIEEIEARDLKKVSIRDLVTTMKAQLSLQRLLSGQSTANVAHNHGYSPIIPTKIRAELKASAPVGDNPNLPLLTGEIPGDDDELDG